MSQVFKNTVNGLIRSGIFTALDSVDFVIASRLLATELRNELLAGLRAEQFAGFSRIGDIARI